LRVGSTAGVDRLAAFAGDLELASALRDFSIGYRNLAALSFLHQELAADQIFSRIAIHCFQFLGPICIDQPRFRLRVVGDLGRRDGCAIDGNHHWVFGVRLDQRNDPEKTLLPIEI